MPSVQVNGVLVFGRQVQCINMGSATEDETTCQSVWNSIPEQDGRINRDMLEKASRRWPDLALQDQQVILGWPSTQLRVVLHAVNSLMKEGLTQVRIHRKKEEGPKVEISVEAADGGNVIDVTLVDNGWSVTP